MQSPACWMKAKLIVNPASGTDAAPGLIPVINERLRRKFETLDIVITGGAGDATRLTRDAVLDGYEDVIVAGGDGTLNEALNGVAQVPGALGQVTLGIIPMGTGNDFASTLGIAADVDVALDTLIDGREVLVDVASLNDVYFINVSAGGFIAEVSDAVSPRLKTLAGRLAYLIGGAQVLLDYEPVRTRVTLGDPAHPDETLDVTLHTFAVCNSPRVGGGRLIAPDARLDDGYLDVCLVQAMPTVEFVALLARVSGGEHVGDPRVTYVRATQLEIACHRVVSVNTDGEVLKTNRCRYRILPRAARFLAPRPPHDHGGAIAR